MIGGKQFDPVLGIDVHIIQPPGPVPPVPVPHPFVGMVFDPMDFAPLLGATVNVNVMPRALAGSGGKAIVPHIPMGGVFVKPPANECEVFMGSATVSADGDALTRLGLPALSCSDIGMPAPPRPKGSAPASLMLPTSVVLSVPMGMPVLVGGPPTISLMAMAMKAFMFLGGKLLKKLKGLQKKSGFWKKLSKKLHKKADGLMDKLGIPPGLRNKVHKGICTLTGHPVDVADGRVLTELIDFELAGPIPLRWERTYYSSSDYSGPLGLGWHHAYDQALVTDGKVVAVRLEDGRGVAFPALEVGTSAYHRWEKCWLLRDERGYALRNREGLIARFGPESYGGVQPLTSVETLAGSRLSFSYRPDGTLRRILDSAGRELRVTVDPRGRILFIDAPHPTVSDQRLTLVQYQYDGDELVEVRDALKQAYRYRYEQGLLVQETNRNGLSFFFQYHGEGPTARCIRTFGDGGIFDHRLRYEEETRVTNVTDSLGHTTRHVIDEAGLVIETVDALGKVSRVSYNAFNEKEEEEDALGQKTFYAYDELGNLSRVLTPDGASLEQTWDDKGHLIAAVDAVGGHWTWEYNAQDQLVSRRDPMGGVEAFEYQGTTAVVIQDPAGQQTRIGLDRQGLPMTMVAPDGSTHHWEYDRLGRLVRSQDALGNERRWELDALGRPRAILLPDGNQRQLLFDGEGNLLRVMDRHQDVRFTYAGTGQLTSRTEAGTTVRFQYDTEAQLLAIENEHGRVYQFELDARGDVVQETGFGGVRRAYVRDGLGRVSRVERPGDRFSEYQYDPAGRVIQVRHSDGELAKYAYRLDGELVQATNGTLQVSLERDRLGRIVRERQGGYWVASERGKLGERVGMRSSLGAFQRIARNGMGDVIEMEVQQLEGKTATRVASWQTRVQRDGLGQELERLLPGGVRSQWRRDRLGRPVGHEVRSQERVLRAVRYQWGGEDRLQQVSDMLRGVTRFGHDPRGGLAWAQYGDGSLELRMPDEVGNLFRREDRRDRRYGPSGELIEASSAQGVTRYRYDVEGNLVEKVTADGGVWAYRWSVSGRLQAVIRPDGQAVTFAYDALGRRVRKTMGGRTTRWVWDGDVPLHEWVEGPALPHPAPGGVRVAASDGGRSSQVHLEGHPPLGPPQVDEEVGAAGEGMGRLEPVSALLARLGEKEKLQPGPAGLVTWIFEPERFAPVARLVEGQSCSIVTDLLGTPVLMVDEGGVPVWSADISIYGMLRHLEGDPQACPFRWPGQYEDEETGLYYNRFRYYDPDAGTYLSPDPIGLEGGMRPASYVSDPLLLSDPFGLESCSSKIKKLREGQDVTVKSFKEADEVLFGAFPNAKKVKGAGKKSHAKAASQKRAFKKTDEGIYHKDYLHNPDDPHGSLHGHEDLPVGHPHKTTPHVNVMTPEGNKATIYIQK